MTRAPVAIFASLWLACDPAPTKEPTPTEPAPAAKPAAVQPPSAEPMPDRKPQIHTSGATDAVLAGDDADDALDALLEGLTDAETPGIRIDAPFVVKAEGAVPVIGAFVRVPKAGEAFVNRVAVLAVSERAIAVAPALRKPKHKGEKSAPAQDVLKGSSFSFDARERLPQTAGDTEVRLYVAYGEHVSNGVTVRAEGDAAPAPVEPSPLVLAGPEAAKTEPGGTVSFTGKASATSKVHILGMGDADPFVHTVEAGADGAFSVNLLGDNPLPKAPGTWHIYALSGEHVSGPITIELSPGDTPW